MRLSIREGDPGYNWKESIKCKIFVDGEDITDRCFTADEELGEAYVYKPGPDGKAYYDRLTNSIPQETLTGKVEIKLNQR